MSSETFFMQESDWRTEWWYWQYHCIHTNYHHPASVFFFVVIRTTLLCSLLWFCMTFPIFSSFLSALPLLCLINTCMSVDPWKTLWSFSISSLMYCLYAIKAGWASGKCAIVQRFFTRQLSVMLFSVLTPTVYFKHL